MRKLLALALLGCFVAVGCTPDTPSKKAPPATQPAGKKASTEAETSKTPPSTTATPPAAKPKESEKNK
jgi:hypothetical protein